jgi:heme oxygenase
MQRAPFLQQLKQRTAASHEALEHIPLSLRLLSEAVTTADYRNYLERLYGFLHPFERIVFPALEGFLPGLNDRRKIPALEKDLAGLLVTPADIPLFEEQALQRTYQTLPEAMGGLYVMEGSSLGGVVITKHLRKKLEDRVAANTRYLTIYGAATGAAWKQFLGHFVAFADNGACQEEIILGAEKTFLQLKHWMDDQAIKATPGSWETTA